MQTIFPVFDLRRRDARLRRTIVRSEKSSWWHRKEEAVMSFWLSADHISDL